MTTAPRRAAALFASAAALVLSAAPALAADPFTVAGVAVDARAGSAIEAQTRAVQDGYRRAAQALLERLTLEEERAAKGLPELTPERVGPLIRGQTIDNERRSTTRYLGDLTIAFNPSAVQRLLRESGLTMISSQAQERLILPVNVAPDSSLGTLIRTNPFKHALTPLRRQADGGLPLGIGSSSSTEMIEDALRAAGLQRALVVHGDGRIEDVGLDGSRRSLQGPLSRAVATLEREWKQTTAVPSAASTTSTVSILYSSLADWQRLQRAINTSAQISDARLDAVSKDGALMTLRHGDFARLQSEMRQKGVILERDPRLGIVIRG